MQKKYLPAFASLTAAALLLPALTVPAYAANELDLVRQLNRAFVEVVEKVSPSVVVIDISQKAGRFHDDEEMLESLPPQLRRYFEEPNQGQGSGVILTEDGYILTNTHVVEDADSIQVRLKDGRKFKAEVRGIDSQSDIAVIKIDAKGLPAARLGDSSKTKVGEFAIAIGAPFELDYSVTFGHISAKGRRMFSDRVMMDQDFLQTDASINPGNSGGPLVNIDGEVIGINTLIRGMRTGIGFAVPINLAREVSDQLVKEGKFTRSWLGIGIATLGEDREIAGLLPDVKAGVIVLQIMRDGPANKSDLKSADVITAVDGVSVATAEDLKKQIRRKAVGKPITLDVARGENKLKIKVSPGALPDETYVTSSRRSPKPESEEQPAALGLKVRPLTTELATQLGLESRRGVVVSAVEADSPAAKKGIAPGDVITQVGRKPVTSPQSFREAIRNADLKEGVLVHITGESGRRFEVLKDSGD